jgi:hypothetical protein
MGWNNLDVNREIDWRQDGHHDATARMIFCQSTVAEKSRA